MAGLVTDVVIDASAALSLVLSSQSTSASERFLKTHGDDRLVAPAIFTWEVTNVLVRMHRRGLSQSEFNSALQEIDQLEIAFAPASNPDEIAELARLAVKMGLRLFDAAYLDLAMARGCALASRDAQLLHVASQHVPCLDLQESAPN